jgi:hypothetical protein
MELAQERCRSLVAQPLRASYYEGKLLRCGMCPACYLPHRAKQQQAQGLGCSGCGAEGKRLTGSMCPACYNADYAKQQQAQGLSCSDCGREGLRIGSRGRCEVCRQRYKREADQRAAVEEYMAAKAKEAAKEAKEAATSGHKYNAHCTCEDSLSTCSNVSGCWPDVADRPAHRPTGPDSNMRRPDMQQVP